MGEVIEENDLARHIRYRHTHRLGALVERRQPLDHRGRRAPTPARRVRFTANFLWMCQGYYRHSEGYTPEWQGMADFKGRIVHPQTWPEDLDYKGKKVVVIGSGATAATLVPAMADDCAHVTMLQRSPTYFIPAATPSSSPTTLRQLEVDEDLDPRDRAPQDPARPGGVHPARARGAGAGARQELLAGVRAYLGPDYDVDTHFTPSYRPWRQRIAFVPDGDLFQGIARRQGLGRHRRDRPLHREGHPAEVRQGARGRHHRHRHRLPSQRAGRHRLRDRRQAARLRRHRDLSRHDVHRRAQHGLGVRLFPRELDAARRPGGRLRLPPARPHEGREARRRSRWRCGPRTRTCRCCPGSTRRTSIPAT